MSNEYHRRFVGHLINTTNLMMVNPYEICYVLVQKGSTDFKYLNIRPTNGPDINFVPELGVDDFMSALADFWFNGEMSDDDDEEEDDDDDEEDPTPPSRGPLPFVDVEEKGWRLPLSAARSPAQRLVDHLDYHLHRN